MFKQKYFKYKIKYLAQLDKLNKLGNENVFQHQMGGNDSEKEYLDMFNQNLDLIGNDVNFPMYFIEFCKRIEDSLNKYKKSNKLDSICILCPSKISSLISLYFETLTKCKYCKFINISKTDMNNENIYKNLPDDFRQIIIMDYLSQSDDISILNKIIENLENKNNLELSKTKYYLTNNEILNDIKKEINNAIDLNTDPIDDDEFEKESDKVLISNFMNLYDYINVSSLNLLINYRKNKFELVKLLSSTFQNYKAYQRIKNKIANKIANKTNYNENLNIIIED